METDFRKVVQSWLDGNFDEATKAQIVALQENDPVALEDAFYRNLEFGTGKDTARLPHRAERVPTDG